MIVSSRALFVHVPKAAGTSVRSWLLKTLPPPLLHIHHLHKEVGTGVDLVTNVRGSKHGDLVAATPIVKLFTGKDISELPLILSCIRNPYDREVAWFSYLDSPLGRAAGHLDGERWGSFEEFTERDSTLDRRLENFYEIDGVAPPNLKLIRVETLEDDLCAALKSVDVEPRDRLPILNAGRHGACESYYTPRAERAVYHRYRWFFERGLYERMQLGADHRQAINDRRFAEFLGGPVRLSGLVRGLYPDGWSGPDLVFSVLTTAATTKVVLHGSAPAGPGPLTMIATVNGSRSSVGLPAGEPIYWALPCRAAAETRVLLAYQAGRTCASRELGLDADDRSLGIRVNHVEFS